MKALVLTLACAAASFALVGMQHGGSPAPATPNADAPATAARIDSPASTADKSKSIKLRTLPASLLELKLMPGADLKDEYQVAALTVAVLCNYENDAQATFEMMDYLRGPRPMNKMDRQFLRDRLRGKGYKTFSFFKGTSPANGYQASAPYTVEVSENAYSRSEENYVKLFLHSSGADSPRPITLRRKPSTGKWFVWQISFLSDIRIPQELDPWA